MSANAILWSLLRIRTRSKNVPLSELPPPPPPSSSNEEIWGAGELTEEAAKEKEIEEYYTKTAGDSANFEKGERVGGNAAQAMDSGMAAELAGLEEKAARLRMEAAKGAEERRKLEEPPPAPKSVATKTQATGVGGKWPTKNKASNFDELD
jgi:hypothetical protein